MPSIRKIMLMGMCNKYINSLKNPSFSSATHHHYYHHYHLFRNKDLPQFQTTFQVQSSRFSFHYQKPLSNAYCVQLIQSSLPINSFAAFHLSIHNYCSETVPMNHDFGCDNVSDVVESNGLGSDDDKVYNNVMEGNNGLESDDDEVYNTVMECNNGLESDADKVFNTIMDNLVGFKNLEKALEQLGIPLSTPLVTGVLHRLRYDEKIAFRFFTWAGNQDNYSHEPCVYNDMMDILSSTKYKVKQFRIVCDVLDYMKRNNKSKVPAEVLLTILKKYTEKYLTHVQKFAKKKRIRVKTQPEINAFNYLLDALCKCCLVEDAEGLYKKMRKTINPNSETYNILVFGWCRVRNPTRGMKLLEEMIELGHKPDNFMYTTALDTYCKIGMITEAVELFDFMRTKGSTLSSPTAKCYAIIIVALAKNDKMEECSKLIGHMISSGCLPDVTTYKDIIEGMSLCGKVDEAYQFLEEMGRKGYPTDIVTYNCFLKVLCENKQSEEALKLYGRMIELNCIPSVQTYNMLISMFFKMDDPDGAFETWQEMANQGCEVDTDTYCVMIEGLFNCNKGEDACLLLEEVIDKGIKLPYKKFDSLLMQLSEIGDLQAIHKLSDHMRKFYNNPMARRYALSQKRKSMSLRGKS